MSRPKKRTALPYAQRAVIKPIDAERLFDIAPATRLRWEQSGRLPKRDVVLCGKAIGWRPATLGITP